MLGKNWTDGGKRHNFICRSCRCLAEQRSRAKHTPEQREKERAKTRRAYWKKRDAKCESMRYRQAMARRAAKPGKEGFVYLISNPAWPACVKIGRTITPVEKRLIVYNTSSPYKDFEVKAALRFKDCWTAEAELHHRLRGHRVPKSEWFMLHPIDAEAALLKLYEEEHS